MRKILLWLKRDPVLFASAVAVIISAFFNPPSLKYIKYPDYRVLGLLLALMLVVAGLKNAGVFALMSERLLKLVHNTRELAALLIGACFFSSMLITNDVALITFVPLTIMLLENAQKKKLMIPIIVLQTISANLGSMLLPMGSPQNLFIYSLSDMTIKQFLYISAVPVIVSFVLLSMSVIFIRNEPLSKLRNETGELGENENIKHRYINCSSKRIIWTVLFIVCLLSVLRLLPYEIVLATVLVGALLIDRRIIMRVDYGLLVTFIFLFILIGNIKSIPDVSTALSGAVRGREMLTGIALSQFISNVPAVMLLSGFTTNYSELLVGVNIGGLGTLIASMASVISFKLYASTSDSKPARYIGAFTAVSILFLAVLCSVMVIVH